MNKTLELISNNLQGYKDIGYHRRFSGSAQFSLDADLTCDGCDRGVTMLNGLEKDYPSNPDIQLCSLCTNVLASIF